MLRGGTGLPPYEKFLKDKSERCREHCTFSSDLYDEHDVKKGLRDRDGKGVVAGITNVSKVIGKEMVDGVPTPCKGHLLYRGYDIDDLVRRKKGQLGLFEECAYLLLFDEFPSEKELGEFRYYLNTRMVLPNSFIKDVILRDNGFDVMNTLSRGVLGLALYDENLVLSDPYYTLDHVMRIMAAMPVMAVYGYQAHAHYGMDEALYIAKPDQTLTVAENILRMMRPGGGYTELEARILDRILVLHMEHGGGNNSTFTARVVSSSGSDTYSVVAAALLSLKGPKHGGANLKVSQMAKDIKRNVEDITDPGQMEEYLTLIAKGEAFDRTGLIYGMGHAVYSLSDPRAEILRGLAEQLAEAKGRGDEFTMYRLIEEKSKDIITGMHPNAIVCANVDLYSGFIYDLLGIPQEMYTPLFAVARTVGWCAHHMEETISSNKIIRPAYVSIVSEREIDGHGSDPDE